MKKPRIEAKHIAYGTQAQLAQLSGYSTRTWARFHRLTPTATQMIYLAICSSAQIAKSEFMDGIELRRQMQTSGRDPGQRRVVTADLDQLLSELHQPLQVAG